MFTVFLKDVSKQTLENMITFMYSVEVSVNQKNVNEFIDIAKAFKIKGLFDDRDDNNESRPSSPASNGSQYQSTQSVAVRAQDQCNYNLASTINHSQHQLNEFDIEDLNEMDQPGYESPIENTECFDGYDVICEDDLMDQQCNAKDDEWNTHISSSYEVDEIPQLSRRAVGKLAWFCVSE